MTVCGYNIYCDNYTYVNVINSYVRILAAQHQRFQATDIPKYCVKEDLWSTSDTESDEGWSVIILNESYVLLLVFHVVLLR